MNIQRVIVFDTETTGLIKKKCNNLEDQPHIVQFSYVIHNVVTKTDTKIVDKIIKLPSNVTMCDECINIHKITNEMSQTVGVEIDEVLKGFYEDLLICDLCVGHNISFDLSMIKIELERLIIKEKEKNEKVQHLERQLRYLDFNDMYYCTMKNSINLCNIPIRPNSSYMKFPRLIELYKKLFDKEPTLELHNSLNDVYVCLECFYKLYFRENYI